MEAAAGRQRARAGGRRRLAGVNGGRCRWARTGGPRRRRAGFERAGHSSREVVASVHAAGMLFADEEAVGRSLTRRIADFVSNTTRGRTAVNRRAARWADVRTHWGAASAESSRTRPMTCTRESRIWKKRP